jgi:hypothetical protein
MMDSQKQEGISSPNSQPEMEKSATNAVKANSENNYNAVSTIGDGVSNVIATNRVRVEENTAEFINQLRQKEIRNRVNYYRQYKNEIPGRLKQLDSEWDVERAIECNASSLALFGLIMNKFIYPNSGWHYLTLFVLTFLLQHAIQGWCPPIPILRRLGFRTLTEINEERAALRVLRGDFDYLMSQPSIDKTKTSSSDNQAKEFAKLGAENYADVKKKVH